MGFRVHTESRRAWSVWLGGCVVALTAVGCQTTTPPPAPPPGDPSPAMRAPAPQAPVAQAPAAAEPAPSTPTAQHSAPAQQPPAYQPPAVQPPPAYQPPAQTVQQPPAYQPPAQSVQQPPAYQPPPSAYQPPAAPQSAYQPPAAAQQPGMRSVIDPSEAFRLGFMQVVSPSAEGQSRYMAIRAATVVAQRELLEALQGVAISGETTIQNGMLASDVVRSQVAGMLRGAVKCGERYDATLRYAEVCLRINIHGAGGLYQNLYPTLQSAQVIQPLPPAPPPPPVQTAPAPATLPADGVIVLLSGQPFKPAIVNRIIVSGGSALFDPSRVPGAVLIERGCGGFTNREDKARALLNSWESRNPMIIHASATRDETDVVISAEDAARLYEADAAGGFLSQAKVVFVVN